MIETLLSEVSTLRATIANMQATNRKRKRDTTDTTIYSEDNILPILKRSRDPSQYPTLAPTIRNAQSAASASSGLHLDMFTARASRAACSLTPGDFISTEASSPTPRSEGNFSELIDGRNTELIDGRNTELISTLASSMDYIVGVTPEAPSAIYTLPENTVESVNHPHPDDNGMPQGLSAAIPDAPAPIPVHYSAGVEIGPIRWGEDIAGQVRGLIARMPRGKTIDDEGVKRLYAKPFPKNDKFVTVVFPDNITAIQFVNAWQAAPPTGYEKTFISFTPV
ncbi:hypothetical protein B0H16DRAFT_1733706 [Mycena metata]|uniref:Uncharacterized protein n=1 Tax=Mycena metata TaxID=1033252 RepID=A0AAD7HXX7_9AGAR|nr:hypothetical protein B0H16DRAFT_1733706 [Mycena metata]